MYSDPYDNLDEIKSKMNEPDWRNPCIIALDVKYPTEPYGGITVIHDGLLNHFDPIPIPTKHMVWYSVYLAERGPEREKVLAMAEEREVVHTLPSGVADDLMTVATYLLKLVKDCAPLKGGS
jgi:hypothetical protein